MSGGIALPAPVVVPMRRLEMRNPRTGRPFRLELPADTTPQEADELAGFIRGRLLAELAGSPSASGLVLPT